MRKHRASPISTERRIDDDPMFLEILVDVALARKGSSWMSPTCGLRVWSHHISWDLPAREEPDFDVVGVPFHSVDAAAVGVEAVAERFGTVVAGTAAGVRVLARGVDEAVGGERLAGLDGKVGVAAFGGVEGNVVVVVAVDAFDNVDFAVVGPFAAAEGPAGMKLDGSLE